MTFRITIVTGGALLALAVSAGAGAGAARAGAVTTLQVTRETPSFHEDGQSRSLRKSHAVKTSDAAKTASGRSSEQPVYPVTYIDVPGPLQASDPAFDAGACQYSGNNCTDDQQACEYWGMNCDGVTSGDQASTSATDTGAGDAAPPGNAVNDPATSDTTPPVATGCTPDSSGDC